MRAATRISAAWLAVASTKKTAELSNVRDILSRHFIEQEVPAARWTSLDEAEIKGESVVIINDDAGDQFTFTASVSKSGTVQHLTVVPKR